MPHHCRSSIHLSVVSLIVVVASVASCDRDQDSPSDEDLTVLAELQLSAAELPESPTNRYADSAAAARLGRRLFFEPGLSANGEIACASCHDPGLGFSDVRERSLGTEGLPGARHSMPITTAALQPFLLWDGRADSAWRQPLFALENELEMDFTRAEVAHFIAERYAAEYEAAFGALPELDGVPLRAKPGDELWETLAAEQQDAVQRVFVNVGKAIEAYERQIVCVDTRFDQWLRGELELEADELDGAARFIGSGCAGCHNGPAVSDGLFHNLGLSRADATPVDTGRQAGLEVLLEDPLNGAGPYSDDPAAGEARIALALSETSPPGAFRTASLRGVGQRLRFGHLGAHTSLEAFIEDTYRRGRGGPGGRDGDGDGRGGDGDGDAGGIVGTLDPLLDEVDVGGGDPAAIATFLRTMSCPDLPPELLEP